MQDQEVLGTDFKLAQHLTIICFIIGWRGTDIFYATVFIFFTARNVCAQGLLIKVVVGMLKHHFIHKNDK